MLRYPVVSCVDLLIVDVIQPCTIQLLLDYFVGFTVVMDYDAFDVHQDKCSR